MARSRGTITLSRRQRFNCVALGLFSTIFLILLGAALYFLPLLIPSLGSLEGVFNIPRNLDEAVRKLAFNIRSHEAKDVNNKNIVAANAVKDQLAIITIDDETLADERFKQWPIPRTYFADLIRFLEKAGAKAVGIDVLFVDHQTAYPKADPALAKALAASQRTILVDTIERGSDGQLKLLEPLDALVAGWTAQEKLERVGVTYEADETITSVPLVVTLQGNDRYTFDILLAARALDLPVSEIHDHSDAGYVSLGTRSLEVTNGALQINYLWPGTVQQAAVSDDSMGNANSAALSINYYPMSAVFDMSDKDREHYFKDRIALIGVSAQAGHDTKLTPLGKMAGVEVHANALLTILSGNFLDITPQWQILLLTLALTGLLGFWLPRLDPRLGLALVMGGAISCIYISVQLLSRYNVWWRPGVPIVAMAVSYGFVSYYVIGLERRAKVLMKSLFEKATPVREDDVINFLLSGKTHADQFETQLEVRERTVLFSDIRDYTVMSESMNADKVMRTLNNYYSEMQTVINECGGKIWEYVGDAQMVIFGEKTDGRYPPECQVKAEFANLNPADQAVHAAVRMVDHLEHLNEKARKNGEPVLDIGIGINSGAVSLGTIKNKGKLVFAAIGDTTNVAARMQAMSKDLKCKILVSQSCFEQLEDIYVSEKVENVKVKGKAEPMTVHRVFAGQQAIEREKSTTHA